MNYEEAVLDFLSKEENLPIALEVSDRIEQLKIRLHEEFWFTFRNALQDALAKSQRANDWQVRMTDRDGLLKDYAKCWLVPRSFRQGQRYLRLALEQGARSLDYPLYYGVHWNRALKTELNVEEIGALADKLKRDSDQIVGGWGTNT